jgi:hypothetical protein
MPVYVFMNPTTYDQVYGAPPHMLGDDASPICR